MPRVLPFRGLRFDPLVVGDLAAVVCPPYDVISPAQQAALQASSPFNVVQVELPAEGGGAPDDRYARAAERLAAWREAGALRQDPRPAYYLHETAFTHEGEPRRRRDLLAALGLEPWAAGAVLPHEHTMAGPKQDRLALMRATHANVSPIWVLAREEPPALADAWAWAEQRQPDAAFTVEGETHRLWVLDEPSRVQAVQAAFELRPPLYMADGHHRYETALAFEQEAGADLPGAHATLAVVSAADDPGLVVLPTHRLLEALPPSVDAEELEVRFASAFHAEYYPFDDGAGADPAFVAGFLRQLEAQGETTPTVGVFGPDPEVLALLELRGRTPPAGAMPADRSEAWQRLDVAIVHTLLLDPLIAELGRPREEVLAYTRDALEAFASVRGGSARVAFFLNPTPVEQVLAVADAGDRMPEKSTSFHPKPPTGLVIRPLGPEE